MIFDTLSHCSVSQRLNKPRSLQSVSNRSLSCKQLNGKNLRCMTCAHQRLHPQSETALYADLFEKLFCATISFLLRIHPEALFAELLFRRAKKEVLLPANFQSFFNFIRDCFLNQIPCLVACFGLLSLMSLCVHQSPCAAWLSSCRPCWGNTDKHVYAHGYCATAVVWRLSCAFCTRYKTSLRGSSKIFHHRYKQYQTTISNDIKRNWIAQ